MSRTRLQLAWCVAAAGLLATPRFSADELAGHAVSPGGEADINASLTPDGRLMAMTDWSSGDLMVRDLTQGVSARLQVKAGGWESDYYGEYVILSPDLRQMVYVWHEGSGPGQLRVRSTAHGATARVLVHNAEFPYVLPAAWSPDGKCVLVHLWKRDYTAQLAWVSVADGSFQVLRSLDWRGAPLKVGRPSLSPDGRYIAYSALERSGSPDSHIYILAADGSRETEVVKESGVNEAPVWMPDGAGLLFVSNRTGKFDLWSLAVRDGRAVGEPALIKRDVGRIYPIGLTRAGSLYYVHDQGGEDVLAVEIDAGRMGAPRRLVNDEGGSNRAPAWSPDGRFLAFKRRSPGNRPGYDLVIRSIADGSERTYPSSELVGTPTRPVWFHDGRTLLVGMADNQNRISFEQVERDSGEFREIVPSDPSYLAMAALSPDDRTVYIAVHDEAKNEGGIVALDRASGRTRRVYASPGFVNNFALSPDGRALAIAHSIPHEGKWQGRLSRMAADGTGFRDLYTPAAGPQDVFGGGPMLAWARDGSQILFAMGAREWRLMRIPASGGKAEFTGLATSGLRHDMDVSPDGARVAFSEGQYSVKELRVIEGLALIREARK
ncbi:MAG TPA: hypothetical protein VJ732_03145 [Bryobacteraceae bacterium]|nr:hypothetical protein [Bryobacteraceae bacterium]